VVSGDLQAAIQVLNSDFANFPRFYAALIEGNVNKQVEATLTSCELVNYCLEDFSRKSNMTA